MEVLYNVFRLIVLLGIVTRIKGQTCTCDLTALKCDVNCCCDQDCSLQDRNAFTICRNADIRLDNRVCVSDRLLYLSNVEFDAQTTGSGLLCIFKDNNDGRNFYGDVTTASSSSQFDELISKYGKQSFSDDDMPQSTAYSLSNSYKVGDKIPVIFETNSIGQMTLPTSSASSHCNDRNPIGFLQDKDSSCTRSLPQLHSQCLSDRSLSAVSYVSAFKVAPNPAFFLGTVTTPVAPSNNASSILSEAITSASPSQIVSAAVATESILISSSSSVIQPPTVLPTTIAPSTMSEIIYIGYNNDTLIMPSLTIPIMCRLSDGSTGVCPFAQLPLPTYDNVNGICKHAVLEVSYIITYSANVTISISAVTAQLTLGDIHKDTPSIRQNFAVKFSKEGSLPGESIPRSGNPGYIFGKPIVAGRLQENAQLKTQAIVVDKNPSKWFTVIRPSVSGTCSDTTQSDAIRFGINIRSGCHIRIKRSMSTAECVLLQSVINETLLGTLPTHVATYGNSLVTNTADWVRVLVPSTSITPSASAGQCTGMMIGVHIDILHSKTGFLGMPQEKIVGVRIKFDSPKTLVYRCFGPFCKSDLTLAQNIEVVQSVGFVDISTTPEAKLKPKPNFEAKAPTDFFYPF